MKNQRTSKRLFFLAFVSVIVAVACQKQVKQEELVKPTGALFDDAEAMAKVPMVVSREFLENANGSVALSRGPKNPKPSSTSDVTPPSVSITSPTNGSAVSGTVTIQASASDNVGVSSVTIAINGGAVATLYSSPYSYSWNTTNIADGTYSITATARDAAGNAATVSVAVTKNTTIIVQPPPPPPPPSSGYQLMMPPVQNQGSEFSCVAFAAGYSARSAEQYYRTGATSYSNSINIFSPEYLYNQTKVGDCGSGTSYIRVLEWMKTYGITTWQSMPYSSTNGCSLLPTSTQAAEAQNYKINSYAAVYTTDIAAIKNALLNKHPLMITVVLDNSFNYASTGFVWRSYSGSGGFNHALVICGYDDSKNAFRVMNSWGTSWGEGGYSWIDYNFLSQCAGMWAFLID